MMTASVEEHVLMRGRIGTSVSIPFGGNIDVFSLRGAPA
jgi:hypothetical protein